MFCIPFESLAYWPSKPGQDFVIGFEIVVGSPDWLTDHSRDLHDQCLQAPVEHPLPQYSAVFRVEQIPIPDRGQYL